MITIDRARIAEPLEVGQVIYNTKIGALGTVESFDGKLIGCVWFDRKYDLNRGVFERKHLWPVLSW